MTTTYKYCFCFRRKFRSTSMDPPKSIVEVFRRYADGSLMGPDQMLRFLVDVQGERDATRELAQEIIDNALIDYRYLNMIYRKGGLSVEEFYRYLFSDANSPVSEKPMVHQDMHAPMSHYFIYTGHNSYLTGNQLSSDSSDVPILKALKRGVRVIELDLWPNSSKTDVQVCHGRTLTTPVELIKCLRSIKEHAFSASPYPLIITLEDHLTPHLQAKVAEMLHQTFGDMLFVPKSLEEFPSPEDLKMRIIISTKPPKEYLEGKEENPGLMRRNDSADEGEWESELPDFSTDIDIESKDEVDEGEDHPEEGDIEEAQLNAAPEYKQLIAVTARNIKGGFKEAFKIEPNKISRLSMSEQVFKKAVIQYGTEIVRFTQKNMLRIYPKGTRIRSSNYNPLLGWMHGAQLVAFNMQGYGRSLWLMHGMFRANGGCGYVKKPDILLNNSPFNPRMNLPVKKVLKVRVFMGDGWRFDFSRTHFDAYSPPDFYTRVGIAGVPSDTIMKKTRVIEDNWTPIWEEEFTFPLSVPELALLRIEVHEYNMSEKDGFAGQTCLPVSELRSGILAVPLFDLKGVKFHSVKVLMQFKFF